MKRAPGQITMNALTTHCCTSRPALRAGQLRAPVWCYLSVALASMIFVLSQVSPAAALDAIVINPDQDQIELTTRGELYEDRGDSLQIETAPGADGITGRMSVNAEMRSTNPHWIVFALTNPTPDPVERLLTADRYNIVGSGAIWPDLDSQRIKAITPSIGFVPERITSDRADVFRVTLEPGQTITYVMELSSDRFARIYLWKPLQYELKLKDRQLFNGILLGLTGLLAIFLTAIFAANHKLIFPAAALVSWCVLAYLCVDFGFFHKLFNLRPEDNAVYRAAAESAMAASLVIFIYIFLRLALWNSLVRMLVSVWILAQLALVALAVIDPRLAATFARLSFVVIAVVGAFFTLFLALRGQDRAMSLIPTWMLFCVWVFAAGVLLIGKLSGDMAVSGLVAFLVLILISIGFTITQFAFRSVEPLYGAAPNELQQRALAVDGAGAAVWLWNARRDEINVGAVVEESLGLKSGELSSSKDDFVRHIHPADRERFELMLWTVQERAGGKIQSDFRLRHADNSYRWFELEAASIATSDPRALRCVGLMRDVTDSKRAHERLVHDAVHDNLTNLPNRSLFLDRLTNTLLRADKDRSVRPAILFIDLDKFKSVNSSFGLLVGDSLLLTVARRLQRHLQPEDTLARVGGDQFAMIVLGEEDAEGLAGLAERLKRSLRSPIKIAGQDVVLTGSMGIAVHDETTKNAADLLKNAEIAMYRAKRSGSDRIELFRAEMQSDRDDRIEIESDLRKALEKNQFKVLYQPVYTLSTEELAGFEALIRWDHPKYGMMNPTRFVPIAEETDLIVKIGSQVLTRAARDAARWHQILTTREEAPLFVSVNISSKQLFRQDLVQDVRQILDQNIIPRGALKLEVTESLVMENPEQAIEILNWLKSAGAELMLDDFGTGYSSLSYLQRFPFDTVKIDQSFIKGGDKADGQGSVLVRSIVAMAHELEMSVVAEGVENPDVAGFLRSVGTEYAQGFFFGEPITQREVIQMLRMLEKSERKLKPRRLFKTRKRDKSADATAATGEGKSDAPVPANGQSRKPQPAQASNQSALAQQAKAQATSKQRGAAPPPSKRHGERVDALPQSSVRPRVRKPHVPEAEAPASHRTTPSPEGPTTPPPPLPSGAVQQPAQAKGATKPLSSPPPVAPPSPSASGMAQNASTAASTPRSPSSPPAAAAPPTAPQPQDGRNGHGRRQPDKTAPPPPPIPTPQAPPVGHDNGTHASESNGGSASQHPSVEGFDGPDYSTLPPSIADSLRRLAGAPATPTAPPPLPGGAGKSTSGGDKG